MEHYQMGTVRETVRWLHEDGYNLAEYALRRFIKTGEIPSVRSGKKALICYSNVLTYLHGGDANREGESCG